MTERWRQEPLEGVDLDDGLAELPLRPSPGGERDERASGPAPGEREGTPAAAHNLDLFGGAVAGEQPSAAPLPAKDPRAERPAAAREIAAPFGERLLGGLADLAVHLGMLAAALLSMSSLELPPALELWPGFLVFLLAFSFLYHVVSLAFWGQTPGMAWRDLRARDAEGQPLSFGQAGARWIGALLTATMCGLPLLLSWGEGGSLSDRLSRSRTVLRAE
ncbi:MAG TPA: RDD family protein [Thermoanaerobaculia bacterium]|nr:RDD family protein [Thermoanaerobaculia bacterium]